MNLSNYDSKESSNKLPETNPFPQKEKPKEERKTRLSKEQQELIDFFDRSIENKNWLKINKANLLKLDSNDWNRFRGIFLTNPLAKVKPENLKYIEQLMDKLDTEYNNGNDNEALEIISKILEIDSRNTYSLNKKGVILLNQNRIENSIDVFKNLVGIDGENYVAFYNMGLAYYKNHEDMNAIRSYTKALNINEKYTDAYYSRGLAYSNIKEYESAVNDFNKVIEMESGKNPDAFYARGLAYDSLGKETEDMNDPIHSEYYKKAILDYEQATKLNYNSAGLLNSKGATYFSLKEDDKALECYKEALALDPFYYLALFNIGLYYEEKKEYKEAFDYYQKALKIDPTYDRAKQKIENIKETLQKDQQSLNTKNKNFHSLK